MRTGKLVLAGSLVIALSITESLHAASDCVVRYSYQSGSGPNKVERESALALNIGETRVLNRSNINWISNRKNNNVRLRLRQNKIAGGVKNLQVTLQGGKRKPRVGRFLSTTKLVRVTCLSGTAQNSVAARTASALVASLKRAGRSVDFIAGEVMRVFGKSQQEVALLLKNAGFTIYEVARAMKRSMGISADDAVKILKRVFRSASGTTVGRALKAAGYSLEEVASALKSQLGMGRDRLREQLLLVGYNTNMVAEELSRLFGELVQGGREAAAASLDRGRQMVGGGAEAARQSGRRIGNAVADAAARRMRLETIVYGSNYKLGKHMPLTRNNVYADRRQDEQRCDQIYASDRPFMSGRRNLDGALGLPNNGAPQTLTFIGQGLWPATAIAGLPAGSSARIVRRGRCAIRVSIRVMPSARSGSTGRAYLMVGTRRGAAFDYSVGALTPGPSPGFIVPSAPLGARGPSLDVEPAAFDVQLYRLASSSEVTDDLGAIYTQLHRDSQSLCQTIAVPRASAGARIVANRRTITLPDVEWGVKNPTRTDIATPFTVELRRGSQVVQSRRVQSLAAGQLMRFTYRRQNSRANIARLNDGYCYHVGRRDDGWNDNPNFSIVVDTRDEIRERREGVNNIRALARQ